MKSVATCAVLAALSLILGVGPAEAATTSLPASHPVAVIISPSPQELVAAERQWGVKTGMVSVFCDFRRPFPQAAAKEAARRGVPLMVSWEPWSWDGPETVQPSYTLKRLTSGSQDAYMRRWLKEAANAKTPVLLRFAPEMNGNWRPWSEGVNSNTAGEYVQAWRHVHALAPKRTGSALKWVWNPAIEYEGSTPLARLYPGGRYVDYLALDGYNWGDTRPWGWQSYEDIFAPSVAEVKKLANGKPWGIAETGSASSPGDKVAWMLDTYRKAQRDGAAFVAWFEYDKETDWRLGVQEHAGAAVRQLRLNGWLSGAQPGQVVKALGLA